MSLGGSRFIVSFWVSIVAPVSIAGSRGLSSGSKPPAPSAPAEESPSAVPSPAANALPSAASKGGPLFPALEAHEQAKFCGEVDRVYARNKWGRNGCVRIPFFVFGHSLQGHPLVYFEAGDAGLPRKPTLIQCGIHGDELPVLPMCLNLIAEIRSGKRPVPKGVWLIVQPLLNPDGMFAPKPTRPNARGVDINRNFPTKDFEEKAVKIWKAGKDKADPRKFPGEKPNSEPETQSIVSFLERIPPQKILSIHTPLGFLDLDAKGDADAKRRAKYLAINMSKNAGNYKFLSYGAFPGSLGNYAGNERQIPTYTLELPPGEGRKTIDSYWTRFRVALWRAVDFDLDSGQFVKEDAED